MGGHQEKIPEPPFTPGKYRHYKGGEYQALGLACHEETLDWYVMYRPLYDHDGLPDVWLRKYELFVGNVDVDGREIRRFTLFDNQK